MEKWSDVLIAKVNSCKGFSNVKIETDKFTCLSLCWQGINLPPLLENILETLEYLSEHNKEDLIKFLMSINVEASAYEFRKKFYATVINEIRQGVEAFIDVDALINAVNKEDRLIIRKISARVPNWYDENNKSASIASLILKDIKYDKLVLVAQDVTSYFDFHFDLPEREARKKTFGLFLKVSEEL